MQTFSEDEAWRLSMRVSKPVVTFHLFRQNLSGIIEKSSDKMHWLSLSEYLHWAWD